MRERGSPVFVLARNVKRRHLTPAQRQGDAESRAPWLVAQSAVPLQQDAHRLDALGEPGERPAERAVAGTAPGGAPAFRVAELWPRAIREEACDRLLEGAWPLLGSAMREIGEQLDRQLDAGDLLVLLASVRGGIAATALACVGADADSLADAVKQARDRQARSALLWPAGLGSELREEVAAREHKSQLELLSERVDERNDRVAKSRLRTEEGIDELLELLRRRLGLRAD